MKNQNQKILRMVEMAMLLALVVILQTVGASIKIGPVPMTFTLVPIVIGAFLLGPMEGAILGAAFGLVTAIMGMVGADPFTFMLWQENPIFTFLICMVKAVGAGLGAGCIYKALLKATKGKYITPITVFAAVSAPIINTGVFLIGMFVCFYDTLSNMPISNGSGVMAFAILGLAGLNFIGEFLVSLILSPAVVRIVSVVSKKISK